jgi:pfkB family carbohydrate kinase
MPSRVPSTSPLPVPSAPLPSGSDVIAGPPIAPIDRLKLYDGGQWEQFVLEWADSLRLHYQCKHYDHPVGAGDAFVAGYLAERLAGTEPARRLSTAAIAGACAVAVPGDCDGMPWSDELDELARTDEVTR